MIVAPMASARAHSRGVVHFHQRRESAAPPRLLARVASSRSLKRSHDQQDRVGAGRARFEKLVLIDDEVLAQ